ncbi:MAG: alcohol dehydrogenase [Chloroflexota bacterium]|nr:MAG: alcohol dehydrogenase [Chloroflexota bacterium]
MPARGEIVIDVTAALTCGTDLKAFLRGHRLFRPPMPFGHEMAGRVAVVGEGVTKFRVGDRVTAANSAPCAACFFCKRGQTNLCEQLDRHLNWGAFAERAIVPAPIVERNTHAIPDALDDASAAAIEPLGCVVAGIDGAAIEPGDTVVVLGATGAIGLMFVQVLRSSGAAVIVAVGRSRDRLAMAKTLGADVTASSIDEAEESVRRVTNGRGADAVIEATGQVDVWEQAPRLARRGGTIVMFGGCPGGTRAALDTGRIHYDALTIRGVFHHTPSAIERSLALMQSGRVRIGPILGAEGRLDDVPGLLNRMARREIVKAVVRP